MKHVFITGATGVLGSALVPLFLDEDGTRITLLLRAFSDAHLDARRRELFDFLRIASDSPDAARISTLRGDVTAARFGLGERAHRGLCETVTHIVHSAANVKMTLPIEEARSMAVGSVENVLALGRAASRSGQLSKIDVVSTVGVAGHRGGLLAEQPLIQARAFHNTYEAAKAEAEEKAYLAMADGLPVTLHRPSMIVASAATGAVIREQIFFDLCESLLGLYSWGIVPDSSTFHVDIVPVDYVARAIHIASGLAWSIGRTLHLCSGPEGSLPADALRRELTERLLEAGLKLPAPRVLTLDRYKRLLPLMQQVAPKAWEKQLRLAQVFVPYLETPQAFANSSTSALLEPQGLFVPPIPSYLSKVLRIDRILRRESLRQEVPPSIAKALSELEKTESKLDSKVRIAELDAFMHYALASWPEDRAKHEGELAPRCDRCILSARCSPLAGGLCEACRAVRPDRGPRDGAEPPRDLERRLAQRLSEAEGKGAWKYDALVLFSGGKDSTYLLHCLKQDFPRLRLLAAMVDNGFASTIALANVAKVATALDVDHLVFKPESALYRETFRHAFQNLDGRSCYEVVDRFDGDLTHDIGRNLASNMGIPLIISGLSHVQVEAILGLRTFETDTAEEGKTRKAVAGFDLRHIYSEELMKYWWDGGKAPRGRVPRMVFPLYAWRPAVEFIQREVVRLGLVELGHDNPLVTNNDLIPLMLAVDVARFGYSGFEPEFARMVRDGKADRDVWLNVVQCLEFMVARDRFATTCLDDVVRRLGLTRRGLGLPHQS